MARIIKTHKHWMLIIVINFLAFTTALNAEQSFASVAQKGGSDITRTFKLLPTPSGVADAGSDYGQAVDIDNGKAVIAAKQANLNGVVFVMEKAEGVWQEVATLQPPPNVDIFDMDFGTSVGISGDWVVVGIFSEGNVGFRAGAAMLYKYENQQWQYQQTIRASDYDQGGVGQSECFGCVVSISGDKLVMGAYGEDSPTTNYGAAYVFHLIDGVWTEQQKLQSSDGYANDRFGEALDIDENTIIIGATGWDQQGNPNGSAYVFEYNGKQWIETQKLNASDGQVNQKFGASVAIKDEIVMVGATRAVNQSEIQTGAVYVFNKAANSWSETQKIIPAAAELGESFGFAIDLDHDRSIIAATRLGQTGEDKAYIFELENKAWLESTSLSAEDTLGGQVGVYGISVAVEHDEIIVGTQRLYLSDGQTHVAYAYSNDGSLWHENDPLMPKESAAGDQFGTRIAYDDQYLAISAPRDDLDDQINGERIGSVYVYHFDGNQWSLEQKIKNPTLNDFTQFGKDVLLWDGSLFISATGENDNGVVYVYQKLNNEWVVDQTLSASDSTDNNDLFGHSIAVSNNTLMISSLFNRPDGGFNSQYGAVYVYEKIDGTWQETQKLVKTDPNQYDYFGYDISIDGDVALVGSRLSDSGTVSDRGSVVVFEKINGSWEAGQELIASDATSFSGFGAEIVLKGNRALITSSELSIDIGFTYVFEYSGAEWIEQTKLIPSESLNGIYYSSSIALYNETIMVGNQNGINGDTNSGSIFVFNYDGANWQEVDIIKQDNPSIYGDRFGTDIFLDSEHLIIGAKHESVYGYYSGAVYLTSSLSDLIYGNGFD